VAVNPTYKLNKESAGFYILYQFNFKQSSCAAYRASFSQSFLTRTLFFDFISIFYSSVDGGLTRLLSDLRALLQGW